MTTTHSALDTIRAMQPDPAKFIQRGRGYVDWKFSEVCACIGYEKGRAYAEAMRRWHDYDKKYRDCPLDRTFQDFLEEEEKLSS